MKFTEEEISLCTQIAEKHRKKIEYGDWYADQVLVMNQETRKGDPMPIVVLCTNKFGKSIGEVPLWTISDCLEFLRERCEDHVFLSHDEDDDEEWYLWFDEYKKTQQMGKGKTLLEVCLKVVLTVLEEGK